MKVGCAKSKNIILKWLLEVDSDHLFIIEDDAIVKNTEVFNEYIRARNLTGILHFCWSGHGPANKNGISKGTLVPRYIIDYGNQKIGIYKHSVGAFCYYTREVIERVGFIDENFKNAFDHTEHSYRIAKAGYCSPYWNWADIADSNLYLDEQECSENSSVIRPRADWQENIQKAAKYFQQKHGVLPAWQNCVPDTPEAEVKKILKDIYGKYDRPN